MAQFLLIISLWMESNMFLCKKFAIVLIVVLIVLMMFFAPI